MLNFTNFLLENCEPENGDSRDETFELFDSRGPTTIIQRSFCVFSAGNCFVWRPLRAGTAAQLINRDTERSGFSTNPANNFGARTSKRLAEGVTLAAGYAVCDA
jgi:hypothetical protein